jgi:hypothetical protein
MKVSFDSPFDKLQQKNNYDSLFRDATFKMDCQFNDVT